MMRKTKSCIIAVLLSLCMVFSLLPVTALAEESLPDVPKEVGVVTEPEEEEDKILPVSAEDVDTIATGDIFEVNGKGYPDLANAVSAASTDKDITVVADYTINSSDENSLKKLTAQQTIIVNEGVTVKATSITALEALKASIKVNATGVLRFNEDYIGGENARFNLEEGSIIVSGINEFKNNHNGEATSKHCKWELSKDAKVSVPADKTAFLFLTDNLLDKKEKYGIELSIPQGATLTVDKGGTLDIPSGKSGTNGAYRAFVTLGGNLIVNGAVEFSNYGKVDVKKTGIMEVASGGSITLNKGSEKVKGQKGNILLTSGGALLIDKGANVYVQDGSKAPVLAAVDDYKKYIVTNDQSASAHYVGGDNAQHFGNISGEAGSAEAVINSEKYYNSLDGTDGALEEAQKGDVITIVRSTEVTIGDDPYKKGCQIPEDVTLVVPSGTELTISADAEVVASMMESKGTLAISGGGKVNLPDNGNKDKVLWVGQGGRLENDGKVTVDFSGTRPLATLEGNSTVEKAESNSFRLHLGGQPIDVKIPKGSILTVKSTGEMKVPSYGDGSKLTVEGTLTVEQGGKLDIAKTGKVIVANGGTLNLPLLNKDAVTASTDGKGMKGDIVINGGATVKYRNYNIIGDKGEFLSVDGEAEAVLNLANASDGYINLKVNKGNVSINDSIKALLVYDDYSSVPMQIEIDKGASATVGSGVTLDIASGGGLTVDGTVNVHGTLEVHKDDKRGLGLVVRDGNVDVSGVVALFAQPEGNITLSPGGKALCDDDISGQIVNGSELTADADKIYDSVVDSIGSKTFAYGWKNTSTSNPGGSYGGSVSSSSGYSVSVDKDIEHGQVSVTPKSSAAGKKVTVKVTPDEGYVLDELIVTDKNGDEIPLTKVDENTYTFTMPKSNVTVSATFVESSGFIGSFTDVPSNEYYADAVRWAVENGVTEGTSETTFSPDKDCTRAEIVTFLWRAAGSPVSASGSSPFTDVAAGTYYSDAVLWAVGQGITTGTGAATFSPDAVCTRAQVVTFLHRYEGTPAAGSAASFTDVAAGQYYTDAVAWAVANGITTGTSATTFAPDVNCSRAEIVTFLYRDLA